MSNVKSTEFFKNDYVDFASYDNLRKIASVMDGLKNAGRKVIFTVLEHNIKSDIKLSILSSRVAEFTEYLHGNCDGVIVGLAQNFAGANNIPLLMREGNFGTRFDNEASAARYIFTYGAPELFQLFNKEDSKIIKKQHFEGTNIEPVHFVPNLPLLLINGSQGVSSGFAQHILPRDPDNIKKYLKSVLSGKKPKAAWLNPAYNNFSGTVEQGDNSKQWIIKGNVEKISANRVRITEIPVGLGLIDYIKILDNLEDDKIIQGYSDLSENNQFLFEVRIASRDLSSWTTDELQQKLKLQKKITENYTVMSENNKILVLNSAEEIIQHYVKVKLEYVQKRKDNQLKDLLEGISVDKSRFTFIQAIVNENLKISKRKKADIEKDLKTIEDIISQNNSYDYLLNMSIQTLTEERMKKLKTDIEKKESEMMELAKSEPSEIWLEEI